MRRPANKTPRSSDYVIPMLNKANVADKEAMLKSGKVTHPTVETNSTFLNKYYILAHMITTGHNNSSHWSDLIYSNEINLQQSGILGRFSQAYVYKNGGQPPLLKHRHIIRIWRRPWISWWPTAKSKQTQKTSVHTTHMNITVITS